VKKGGWWIDTHKIEVHCNFSAYTEVGVPRQ
jgi:hypothetical protein